WPQKAPDKHAWREAVAERPFHRCGAMRHGLRRVHLAPLARAVRREPRNPLFDLDCDRGVKKGFHVGDPLFSSFHSSSSRWVPMCEQALVDSLDSTVREGEVWYTVCQARVRQHCSPFVFMGESHQAVRNFTATKTKGLGASRWSDWSRCRSVWRSQSLHLPPDC